MKSLYLSLLFMLMAGVAAKAQGQLFKKYDFEASVPYLKTDTTKPYPFSIKNNYTTALLDRATYSHSTQQGKVYVMPYDHSACIVPDMNQVKPMPVLRPKAIPAMPNGYKVTPQRPKRTFYERYPPIAD